MSRDSVRILQSSLLAGRGRVHAFSTRVGGVSTGPFRALNLGHDLGDPATHVEENLARLLRTIGRPDDRVATVVQVHGRHVTTVTASSPHPFPRVEADGLITDVPGWLLGVRTADCVPVLMAAKVPHRVVAAVHAGWRGTAAGIVTEAVRLFQDSFGVPPRDILVALGPSIGPECYVVGPEVVAAIEAVLQGHPRGVDGVVFRERDASGHRLRVHLQEANRRLLELAGVPPQSIDVLPWCVHCREDLFFSHRRDHGATGRMLSLIGLT